ncbi:hypothetical protein Bbelb_024800 [Branchiostoma belcheri]|nr:hypothetical protein Bbelb_024800 [Branchiostoma belcheri]
MTMFTKYLRRVTCAGPYIPVHTTNYQVSGRVRRYHRPAHAVADISCTHPDTPGHAKFHGTCTGLETLLGAKAHNETSIHLFRSPPTPRCQGLYLPHTHSKALPHCAAKGYTCHTPIPQPSHTALPRAIPAIHTPIRQTSHPALPSQGYACHTPIPQTCHTAFQRAIPAVHPFHSPPTPRFQGLYLPYIHPFDRPAIPLCPARTMPAIHPFHRPATPRFQGLYLQYTHSTALPHRASKGYTCHTYTHSTDQPSRAAQPGLCLPYTHSTDLPHRASKGYTCSTPIPQPSHTALPRAVPAIHPFNSP